MVLYTSSFCLFKIVNFWGRKVSPTLGYVLANLELNTDIFGCKGVYYPRSKLFSRQSKPKRTHYNPIKIEREQNVVFWLKIELEIGTLIPKMCLHRCISHSQNCVMAILSDFFSRSLDGIITIKKSAIKGSKCFTKEMSCVVNRMSSEKNPILEIKLNMK